MAFLYVTEFGKTLQGTNIPMSPEINAGRVAIGTEVKSPKFSATTRVVMVHADAICSVKFGVNPVAVATDTRMAANETRLFGVRPGDKVSVITNT